MGNVKMIVWDVQHGNAIYLETPNGKNIIFDLGIGDYSGQDESFSPLNNLWSKYGVRTIDFLIITHPHLDHIDDILNLEGFSVKALHRTQYLTRAEVMQNVRDRDKEKFEKYFHLNDTYNTPLKNTSQDISVPENYGDVTFEFFRTPSLPTNNLNNHSTITVIKHEGIKIIIPGDNEIASLNILMEEDNFKRAIKDCDVLIAPHHGRNSAYHTGFVSHANPRLTIISDGSICDTSANSKYSNMSRGWGVFRKMVSSERKLLTTNSDGEIYIDFGKEQNQRYLRVEIK